MSRTSQAEKALIIAREALQQIARDRQAARPTAFYRAKAAFALDRIEALMHAIDTVLARRVSEAARTGPWDAGQQDSDPVGLLRDERERCARHIEALAVAIRDHGPKTPEGLLTGIAGAQVGVLLDAAASLRLTRTGPSWGRP